MDNKKYVAESSYTQSKYYVETKPGVFMEPWRVEKRCLSEEQALKYLQEFGKTDYQGKYHGHAMRVVCVEVTTTTYVLEDNQNQ